MDLAEDVTLALKKKKEALYEEARALLQNKVYRLGSKSEAAASSGAKGSFSAVWNHYYILFDAQDNEVGISMCKICKTMYTYGGGNGSGAMSKHLKTKNCFDGPRDHVAPNAFAKGRMKRSVVRWVAEAMKPHEAVENAAFIEVVQMGIDLGASFGSVDAKALLPKRTCVRESIVAEGEELREEKLPEIRKAMLEGGCGACTDLWVEKYSRTHYLALTVSYMKVLQSEWSIETVYLFMIDFDEEATAENIREKLIEKFHDMGILPEEYKNLIFVSDNGSNVKSALSPWSRHYCMCHALNIVLRGGLELKYHELLGVAISSCPEVEQGINACEEAVQAIKRARKRQLSERFRPLQVLLRNSKPHNSKMEMLMSVRAAFDEVVACLASIGSPVALGDLIDSDWLDKIIAVLSPFDHDGTRKEKSPSVGVKTCVDLLAHCEVTEGDIPCVVAMKEALSTEMGVTSILKLVQNCKQLITYLKTSGLDQTHPIPNLRQEFEVRWNTHVDITRAGAPRVCLDTPPLCPKWITEALEKNGQSGKLTGIDRERVQLLIKLWLPFKQESNKMEGEAYPTLPLVVLALQRLHKHCEKPLELSRWSDDECMEEVFEEEEDDFRRLRLKTARLLQRTPQLDITHQIGLLLHPKYRNLQILGPEDREKVFAAVRELLDEGQDTTPSVVSPPKRSKLEEAYEEFEEEWTRPRTSGSVNRVRNDELTRYLEEADSIPTLENLLEWWRTKVSTNVVNVLRTSLLGSTLRFARVTSRCRQLFACATLARHATDVFLRLQGSAFPKLQQLARRLLAIPASSAPCERVFSNAGHIINVRRTNLKPSTVDAHVFLHKHFVRERRAREKEERKRREDEEKQSKEVAAAERRSVQIVEGEERRNEEENEQDEDDMQVNANNMDT
ncbi:Transposable element Hobo transposase [Frankliniella fusca]|uniref:Transposable element Hobo transposase n=1 Tax=Frankliniella fusca TaxID=407009 RepID=A0AAE1HM61_9NEOP|nr:Transposable element Hobo transposase [Frankliniella fusca]